MAPWSRRLGLCALLTLMVAPAPSAWATPTPELRGPRRLVTLELQSVDIEKALALFGELGGFNIVMRKPLSGVVTARFRNVPWSEAFASLLRSQGLEAEFDGNLIYVAPAG